MTEEPKSFKYADHRVRALLVDLNAKNVCGCCAGRALMLHAAALCERTMGSNGAAEMLEEMSHHVRKNRVPVPDGEASVH